MKPMDNPNQPDNAFDKAQLRRLSEITIGHYDRSAEDYWRGTRDHDVSQNYEALLEAIEGEPPYAILDLGCGAGRGLSAGTNRVTELDQAGRANNSICSHLVHQCAAGTEPTMDIQLYYAPTTCALAPYITLTEANAVFTAHPLNFRK